MYSSSVKVCWTSRSVFLRGLRLFDFFIYGCIVLLNICGLLTALSYRFLKLYYSWALILAGDSAIFTVLIGALPSYLTSVSLNAPLVGMLRMGRELTVAEPKATLCKLRPDMVWNGLPIVSPGLSKPLSIISICCIISWILPTLIYASSSPINIDPWRGML